MSDKGSIFSICAQQVANISHDSVIRFITITDETRIQFPIFGKKFSLSERTELYNFSECGGSIRLDVSSICPGEGKVFSYTTKCSKVNVIIFRLPNVSGISGPTGPTGPKGERGIRGPVGPIGPPEPSSESCVSTCTQQLAHILANFPHPGIQVTLYDGHEIDGDNIEIINDCSGQPAIVAFGPEDGRNRVPICWINSLQEQNKGIITPTDNLFLSDLPDITCSCDSAWECYFQTLAVNTTFPYLILENGFAYSNITFVGYRPGVILIRDITVDSGFNIIINICKLTYIGTDPSIG